jgi:hypothetical protein
VATVPTTYIFFIEHSQNTGAENNPITAEGLSGHLRTNISQKSRVPSANGQKTGLLGIPGFPRAGHIRHSARNVKCRRWLPRSFQHSDRKAANINGLQREGTMKGRTDIVLRSSFRFSFAFLRVESR